MKTCQIVFQNNEWFYPESPPEKGFKPHLGLCFGERKLLEAGIQLDTQAHLACDFPMIYCSSAGEIINAQFKEQSLVCTFIEFEASDSRVEIKQLQANDFPNSLAADQYLSEQFDTQGLRFVLVFSDGQLVNGSDLIAGIHAGKLRHTPVSGGMAGDDDRFEKTLVGCYPHIEPGAIVGIGFYGSHLQYGFGSKGGWENFGLTRTITKSDKNVLQEIDGENALDFYIRYLGPYAEQLPASALLFPLSVFSLNDHKPEVVRTILNINKEDKTMTFAGNVPVGSKIRLMRANLQNLAKAAAEAAKQAFIESDKQQVLAILVSCVGRKLIFKHRIEEELEAAMEQFGNSTQMIGFYSYGEICPHANKLSCELHNQTMTITLLSERIEDESA